MIYEWLVQRENDAIWEKGFYSAEADFWTLLLDAHCWWWERVSPSAYWYYVVNREMPPTWSEIRKAGSTKYKYHLED